MFKLTIQNKHKEKKLTLIETRISLRYKKKYKIRD